MTDKKEMATMAQNVVPEEQFVADLRNIAGEARCQAYRASNQIMVVRNWLIGRRIVEREQQGNKRAEYGKRVIALASEALTAEYGKGFGWTSIRNMRQFYLIFKDL